jgi:hypothetical protein
MPGSGAERAGLRAGDRVVSVEGVPVEKLGMESRWPRSLVPRAGESRRFLVARQGEQLMLDIVHEAPSRDLMSHRIGGGLMGLAWLLPGLWAWFAVGTEAALLLARIGLAAAGTMAFGLGPNLGWWSGISQHVSSALTALFFLLLAWFFLRFPRVKRAGESRVVWWLLYAPWAGLVLFLILEVMVHPALYYSTGSMVSALALGYGTAALAALVHTLLRTPRGQMWGSGTPMILGGLIVSVLAMAGGMIWNAPGWSFGLAMLPLALSMAVAVQRAARAAQEKSAS